MKQGPSGAPFRGWTDPETGRKTADAPAGWPFGTRAPAETADEGEWRGYCVCDAGQALKAPLPAERCKCGYPMPCVLTVPVQFCRA